MQRGGVRINKEHFADDAILLVENPNEMQAMVSRVVEVSGMNANIEKTEIQHCFAWKTQFLSCFLIGNHIYFSKLFSHSSSMTPEPFQWGFKIEFPFGAENSTDSHSLHLH